MLAGKCKEKLREFKPEQVSNPLFLTLVAEGLIH
jgi:hypothetical protein